MADENTPCTAFHGWRRIASGLLSDVAAAAKAIVDSGDETAVTIFEDATSQPIEVDFRGTIQDVRARLTKADPPPPEEGARGPGRPKLGVVAREVTLLPRHWDWLAAQPGGASVALRRLVEEARRDSGGRDRIRSAQEAANRFMTAMAGDQPQFEEASRALFAKDESRFVELTRSWPADIRDHSRKVAAPAFREE